MPSSFFKKISAFSLIINLLSLVGIFFLQKKLPPIVPLLYGLPVSKSQLVPSLALTIPSIVSICFIAGNFLVVLKTKDKFLEKVLSGLIITITILSQITTINIFMLISA